MNKIQHYGVLIYQDGVLAFSNPDAAALLGLAPEEMASKLEIDFFSWIHVGDSEQVKTAIQAVLKAEIPVSKLEVRLDRIPIPEDTIDVYISPTHYEGKAAALILLLPHDRQEQVEAVMRDILAALAGAADIQQALEIILINLHNLIDYDRVGLFLSEESKLAITPPAAETGRTIELASQDHPLVAEFQSSGRPIIVEDAQKDERFSTWTDIGPVRGWLGAPLLAGQRFIGFLSMGSLEVGAYSSQHVEMMAAFANQVAEVLDKAWTYEESRRRTEQLEVLSNITFVLGRAERRADTLAAIVAEISEFFGTGQSAFMLADQSGDFMVVEVSTQTSLVGYAHARSDDLIWQVYDRRQPAVLVDIPGYLIEQPSEINKQLCSDAGAAAFIPITFADATFGVLCLVFSDYRHFSFEDIRLYDTVAEIAGFSLHRAIILQSLERQVDIRTGHLSTLYEINALASEPLDLDAVLEHILEILLRVMAGSAGAIHLLDQGAHELRLVAQQGLSLEEVAPLAQLSLEDEKLRSLLYASEPLVAPNISAETRLPAMFRSLPVMGYPTYIGVPIRAEGHELGLLSVLGVNLMGDAIENLALLMTISDQIGGYIERASLVEQAERAAVIEERQRLARELHDSVTQLLYSQVLFSGAGLKVLDQGDTETVEEHLNRINQAALQALKEMRLMIYELRPATLLDEGLVVALEHRLDAVERRTGVDVIFQVRGNPDLDNDTQMALFRISEEALNNTLKHARAASVEVKLECDRKRFCLQIIDDGCGFDPELQDQRGGMGLSNMQARADGLGARLEMKSAPGEGTRITVMMDMDP